MKLNTQTQDLKRLQSVCDWLTRAYQITGRSGFSIGFDLRRGWLAPYSETTGYIIPTCYRFADLYGQPEFAEMATSAAQWLVSIQSPEGWFPDYEGSHSKPRARPAVVFNTGQDIFGLLAAYRITGESLFLHSAHRAGQWIAQRQSANGIWREPGFGTDESASYYTRVTWPLQLLANETGDHQLAVCAQRGLEAILTRVQPNGSVGFWGFQPHESAFTHTIAYTIEGLLEQGLLQGQDAIPVVVARTLALRMLGLLEKHGRLAGAYDENWRGEFGYVCVPGNCQLALIFLRLYLLDGSVGYLEGAERILAPILAVQLTAPWVPDFARGTVPGSWPPLVGRYMRWLYPNWSAKFLADALMLKLGIRAGASDGAVGKLMGLLEAIPG